MNLIHIILIIPAWLVALPGRLLECIGRALQLPYRLIAADLADEEEELEL